MTEPAALTFAGHSVSFGATTITENVSFDLIPGSILALVGESGSGKSVTALAALGLAGANARQSGSVRLAGPAAGSSSGATELVGLDAQQLRPIRGGRIGVVFQEPMSAFNPMFRVGHQIAEAVRAHAGQRGSAGSQADASASGSVTDTVLDQLAAVGLGDPERVARAYPHELSGGQLQRAMIALATINSPEVLFADEPTTALDVTVQTGILDLLKRQAEAGQAVLLITHDMGVVADIADRVAVMRSGRIVETGDVQTIFSSPASDYTRELLDAVPRLGATVADSFPDTRPRDEVAPRAEVAERPSGPGATSATGSATSATGRLDHTSGLAPAAELRAASVVHRGPHGGFTAVDAVDLVIPPGTITGLVGESGSGKSTIANVLTGGQTLTSGTALIDGNRVSTRPNRRQRRLRAEIGVVFQDPRGSLNPRRTVGNQIAEPLRVHRDLGSSEISARIARLLEDVHLPASFAERYPHELSGGQRQRVSIARALSLGPKLLIADEPTSALDVSVQRGVLSLLSDLHAEHEFACLFISHDLAVVEQLASQVVVLRHGAIVEQGTSAEVLRRPRADYTRELIESAPVPDPAIQAARRIARLAAEEPAA